MGFTTPCLAILLLCVAAASEPTSSPADIRPVSSQDSTDLTTEDRQLKPSVSIEKSIQADNMPTRIAKVRQNDDNDVGPDDVTMDALLLFESLIADEADVFKESSQTKPDVNINKENIRSGDIDSDSSNPIDSKASTESDGIRRQGEVNPAFTEKKPSADVQFDDSKQEVTSDPPPRFGQRSRIPKQRVQDGGPVLQLTQGGYDRPFKRPRFRNRYVSRPDSSEQSEEVLQQPDRNTNRQQKARRIVPQVAYTAPPQPVYNSFGPGPILRPAFEAPARNILAINHIVPTTTQAGFLNTPPAGFTDYTTAAFQSQFQPSNDVGGFPNFGRGPNSVAFYQAPQRNPFQDARLLYQDGPQVQTQPILIDSARNDPPHFQPHSFSAFPNFDNVEDNSRPNYASYFRGPTNPQFQVPPNFYGANPNGDNTFNNPPISFLSNPPNSDERYPTQFFRYPVTTDTQNRQNVNDRQPDPDASQEDKKTNVGLQGDARPANNDETPSVPFGTRIQDQNDADVYIRYPTNEAGYAVEENLPPRNNSDEAKDNGQQAASEERNFPNADPYRNALNSLRTNQRRNNSYEFPPPLFSDVPIDFGYQRPPNQIFLQQPNRNRGLSRFPSPDFNSRRPFDPITSLPENNYQYLNAGNQRRGNQKFDEVPTCAKQNNATICFEDDEYPKNEILYSLNSNSFLADRLSGPELPLDSIALVERNTSQSDQTSDNYACTVDIRYGSPLRAKNLAGVWRIIVSLRGRFSQPVRLEVCKSLGDACSYADSRTKTTCVQKYNLQRLLTWSPDKGIYSDIYKLPVACSCQILKVAEA